MAAGLLCCNKDVINTPPSVPVVSTLKLLSSTYNTYTVGGKVETDGSTIITERGICYKAGNNPTIKDSCVKDTGSTGQFSVILTKLTPNCNYSYRAYAIYSSGYGYGVEMHFTTNRDTTKAITKPTVSMNQQTVIGLITGYLLSDGGSAILKRGFCYSRTKMQPDLTDSVFYSNDTTAIFTDSITNLRFNTVYYVTAFATNAMGTSYSGSVMFMSAAPAIAVVATNSATATTYSSGLVSGTIMNGGGAMITEKGVCFSTTSGPTVNNSKVINADTGSVFSANILYLLPSTTYYVRAYAINAGGIAYGNELSFTTLAFTSNPSLNGNYVKQKIMTHSTSGILSNATYYYDSMGRLSYYKSGNSVLYNYSGNSLYPSSDGVSNYYKYDNIGINLVSDSILSGYGTVSCTFSNSSNVIDGTKLTTQRMQGGSNSDYQSTHIVYSNNNVSVFNYYDHYQLMAPQQLPVDNSNSYSAQYTYTTYLNPEYSIKAIMVNDLTGMNSYWYTSYNMPLTENLVITNSNGNKTTVTSVYTYTLDMMGRVIQQVQTASTGVVITTDYTYY